MANRCRPDPQMGVIGSAVYGKCRTKSRRQLQFHGSFFEISGYAAA